MKLQTVDRNITVQSSNVDLGSSLPEHPSPTALQTMRFLCPGNPAAIGREKGRIRAAHGAREAA